MTSETFINIVHNQIGPEMSSLGFEQKQNPGLADYFRLEIDDNTIIVSFIFGRNEDGKTIRYYKMAVENYPGIHVGDSKELLKIERHNQPFTKSEILDDFKQVKAYLLGE